MLSVVISSLNGRSYVVDSTLNEQLTGYNCFTSKIVIIPVISVIARGELVFVEKMC